MNEHIAPFEGFGPRAISFWSELEKDNTKSFFAAHRDVYETDIRVPMERLLAHVSEEFGDNSKVFRPHRDVRFSKDKSPYKVHCGAVIGEGSGQAQTSVYYVQISAAGIFSASGCYMMSRDQLQRFYAAIDDDDSGSELEQLVADARAMGLDVGGSTLKTAPRGYSADHARVELLRHKSLTVAREFPPSEWMYTVTAADTIARVWRDAAPLNAWLAHNVGPAEEAGRR
ncbi:MAG: DUF2461 domain-containing protein [Ornithinimicrobium sp.]